MGMASSGRDLVGGSGHGEVVCRWRREGRPGNLRARQALEHSDPLLIAAAFTGQLDDVRVYSRALNDEQIMALANDAISAVTYDGVNALLRFPVAFHFNSAARIRDAALSLEDFASELSGFDVTDLHLNGVLDFQAEARVAFTMALNLSGSFGPNSDAFFNPFVDDILDWISLEDIDIRGAVTARADELDGGARFGFLEIGIENGDADLSATITVASQGNPVTLNDVYEALGGGGAVFTVGLIGRATGTLPVVIDLVETPEQEIAHVTIATAA